MHILFVCTGNTCRSPMAEAITRSLAAQREIPLTVSSAGIRPESAVAAHARTVLQDRGIELGDRPAVQLTPEMLAEADLTLCAAASHWELLHGLKGNVQVWGDYVAAAGRSTVPSGAHDLADPVGQGIEVYERTAAQIDVLAAGLLDLM